MGKDDNYEETESAEYSPKSEFSKAKVTMETVQKCIEARSKEMRKGYYNTTMTKDGLPIKTWIEDTRKVYVSAVTALRKLLIPEIIEDENYKRLRERKKKTPLTYIDSQMRQAKKDFSYTFMEGYKVGNLKKFRNTKKTSMPEIDTPVKIRQIYPDGNEKLVEIVGYWNQFVNSYWNTMVELNDLLFEQLMRVIHRKNYFKQSIGWG